MPESTHGTGTATQFTSGEARYILELGDVVHYFNPSDTPVLTISLRASKQITPVPVFNWMEDEYFIQRSQTFTMASSANLKDAGAGVNDTGSILVCDRQSQVELFEKGGYSEAAKNLVGLTQDDPKAIALLARAYANLGKLNDALEWSKKAVDTDKLNPSFHYLRATILQEQGEIEGAITSLKRALYLEPDFALAHFALGNLAWQQGKIRESDRHFRNALSILHGRNQTDLLPESDGITAGRLSEIISCMTERE